MASAAAPRPKTKKERKKIALDFILLIRSVFFFSSYFHIVFLFVDELKLKLNVVDIQWVICLWGKRANRNRNRMRVKWLILVLVFVDCFS